MPNLLALDTSSPLCSVALLFQQRLTFTTTKLEHHQAQHSLALIAELLSKANTQLEQLNALVFTSGPGSFTGLRIAASVIQGLGFAANLPILSLSSLQLMAQGAFINLGIKNVLIALDARGGEIYWGIYQLDKNQIMRAVSADQRCNPELATIPAATHEQWVGIGDGWTNYSQQLQQRFAQINLITIPCFPHAKEAIQIATSDWSKNTLLSAEQAIPHYFHEASTWKKSIVDPPSSLD